MSRYVAGIDLGSTNVKVLVADADAGCAEVLVEQRPTPWRQAELGRTELDPDDLVRVLAELLAAAAAVLTGLRGDDARVEAVSIAGMGETGVLIDAGGAAAAPAIAWFDPRGDAELAELRQELRTEFPARTGLPLGVQVTAVKLASLVREGLRLDGLRWLNLPDHLAFLLTGSARLDRSLTARTGLLDQDTGAPWTALLARLGADARLLPPILDAGVPRGRAHADWLPAVFDDAAVSVAGHDHLVSAAAGGAVSADAYHASIGTAEVVLRVIDAPLPAAARVRLAEHFINHVPHVVPGRFVLVAGVKSGLLMRRALQLAGIPDRAGRDALDAAVLALPVHGALAKGSVEVSGARNDDGVLSLVIRADGVDPAELFIAVLEHGNDELAVLIAAMDREVPPATTTLLTGGWAGMRSVQRARALVLPGPVVSERDQDTAHGAALSAARLLLDEVVPASPRPSEHHPLRKGTNQLMNPLTTLERRAMSRITTEHGRMLIVAADQRNGMKAVMKDAPGGAASITKEQLADAKADLVRHLANHGPAILLDPEIALPAIVDDGVIAPDTALVVGMDASGFHTVDGLRYTDFVPGIDARRVRDLGGDAAKMLFYMRPDRQGADSAVVGQIRELVQACTDEGVLLIVEILTYQLEDETAAAYAAVFPQLVIDATRLSVDAGAKVLKLPYPGSVEACIAVNDAARGVPWAVLSAGVDHETFIEQVSIAVAHGSSGAMAGRSLWKDSLAVSAETRNDLLTTRALPRLRELEAAVAGKVPAAV